MQQLTLDNLERIDNSSKVAVREGGKCQLLAKIYAFDDEPLKFHLVFEYQTHNTQGIRSTLAELIAQIK